MSKVKLDVKWGKLVRKAAWKLVSLNCLDAILAPFEYHSSSCSVAALEGGPRVCRALVGRWMAPEPIGRD
jgi:hypothetical protein